MIFIKSNNFSSLHSNSNKIHVIFFPNEAVEYPDVCYLGYITVEILSSYYWNIYFSNVVTGFKF